MLSIASIQTNAQELESVYLSKLKTGDNIYVITNRTAYDKDECLSYNNEVNAEGQLAFVKVTFYKPDSICSQLIEHDELFSRYYIEKSDWLLFVHGDSKTYEESVMRGFDIKHLHNIDVIVFSWPSKDPNLKGVKNFKNSKNNVIVSMNHFTELLSFMDSLKNDNVDSNINVKLSMFIHSLGNSFVENLFALNSAYNNFNNIFDNVVLNSAAVNQKMHKNWVEKLNIQERVYITSNRSDFNLKGVRIFTKDGKQLGEKVKAPTADNACYINFSKAVGFRFPTGTTHTYFIGEISEKSKNIREFYYEILHGNQIDFSDTTKFSKRKDSIGYDIIF